MKKYTHALILLILLSVNAYTQDSTVTTVGPGTKLHTVFNALDTLNIRILEIDLSNPNLEIKAFAANDHIGELLETTSNIVSRKLSPKAYIIGAINADYFGVDKENGWEPYITNIMIADAKTLNATNIKRSCVGFTNDNTPIFQHFSHKTELVSANGKCLTIESINGNPKQNENKIFTNKYARFIKHIPGRIRLILDIEEDCSGDTILATFHSFIVDSAKILNKNQYVLSIPEYLKNISEFLKDTVKIITTIDPSDSKIKQLVGAGPMLLKNGRLFDSYSELEGLPPGHTSKRHPRTAVGYNDDTNILYFVTVDGRQENLSKGMTLSELAQYLKSIGCTDAANLDGGGSTTLTVRDSIVNSPSDKTGERPVVNMLALLSTEGDKYIESISFNDDSKNIPNNTIFTPEIFGTDSWGYQIPIKFCTFQIIGVEYILDANGNFLFPEKGKGTIIATYGELQDTLEIEVK